jgi:S-formylglutathione hydrolase FrmB
VAGGAEQASAKLPMIIVSPDIAINGDGGGWCTNWFNTDVSQTGGPHDWEAFHIKQLIPWIDHNLRTRTDRSQRAIAGLSQGGFCSTSYPARHPDLFGISLSYSGAPDIAYTDPIIDPMGQIIPSSTAIINAIETGFDHVPANSAFGPRATNELNWANHDPATLAGNLRDTRLFLWTGNGQIGPFTTPDCTSGFASYIESLVGQDTDAFHSHLTSLGIPSVYDNYGPGTHCFAYWARDLQQTIGAVAHDFSHPSPPPRRVTYTNADPTYTIYGWGVAMHRAAAEFSTLEDADARGFALAGSGAATVLTPPSFVPQARYAVALRTTRAKRTIEVRASRRGRLRIVVPLGPANPQQQFTAGAATAVFTTKVKIRRVPTPRPRSR